MANAYLAKVGDLLITDADIDRVIASFPEANREYLSTPEGRERILNQKIANAVMAKSAKVDGIVMSEKDAILKADFEEQYLAQTEIQAAFNSIQVTEEDLKNYYDECKESFRSNEAVGAKHILVDTEEQISEIKAKLDAGEITFEDAAKQFSTCPSSADGGDLGMFEPGMMVPEFDAAAFSAEVDVVTEPVKTQFGYHLIKVYEKKAADIVPFEEVKDQIQQQMLQMKQNEVLVTKIEVLKAKYGDVQPDEASLDRLIAMYPAEHQSFLATEEGRKGIRDQKIAYMVLSKAAIENAADQTEEFKATAADYEEQILAQAAIEKLFNSIKVSEEEMQKYYEISISNFRTNEQVNANHILVDTEEQAKAIKARIDAGEISFEDAAKECSTCPSRDRGGDLGYFEHGRMVAEFDKAAFAAEVDVVTEPVKTQFGYHLIKVVDKKEASVKPFGEVRNQIELQMVDQRKNEAYFNQVEALKVKYGVEM